MSNEFAAARSGLSNALNVIGPMLTAMQQADAVFGVLANAEKHKRVLETEVADWKAELEKSKAAVAKAQQKLKDVTAEIGIAESDADVRIRAALEAEQKQTAAAKEAAVTDRAKYAKMAADALQDSNSNIAKAQAASAAVVIELAAKESDLSSSIAALEKKLATMRASAQKFAAALTGE